MFTSIEEEIKELIISDTKMSSSDDEKSTDNSNLVSDTITSNKNSSDEILQKKILMMKNGLDFLRDAAEKFHCIPEINSLSQKKRKQEQDKNCQVFKADNSDVINTIDDIDLQVILDDLCKEEEEKEEKEENKEDVVVNHKVKSDRCNIANSEIIFLTNCSLWLHQFKRKLHVHAKRANALNCKMLHIVFHILTQHNIYKYRYCECFGTQQNCKVKCTCVDCGNQTTPSDKDSSALDLTASARNTQQ